MEKKLPTLVIDQWCILAVVLHLFCIICIKNCLCSQQRTKDSSQEKCINIYNDLPSKSYSLSNFNLEHSLTLVTASCHNLVIAILSLSVVNGSCLDYEVTLAWELNF